MPEEKLEAMLARSEVVVNVPAEVAVAFHGLLATAKDDSTIYLRANKDGVALAVLFGEVEFAGQTIEAGQVCFWSRDSAQVEVAEFDAATFLTRQKQSLAPHVVAGLKEKASRQAEDLWWGKVEREPLGF